MLSGSDSIIACYEYVVLKPIVSSISFKSNNAEKVDTKLTDLHGITKYFDLRCLINVQIKIMKTMPLKHNTYLNMYDLLKFDLISTSQ